MDGWAAGLGSVAWAGLAELLGWDGLGWADSIHYTSLVFIAFLTGKAVNQSDLETIQALEF